MHNLLDRYSDVCSAVIERHGGTVEGFIGDAVVGVFGLAELHEDDALRAVRAAVELREAGRALSVELERERGVAIAMKLGVESGEVFVSAGTRRSPFAAGDAFNVAFGSKAPRPRPDPARREHLSPGRGRSASRANGAARASRPGGQGAGLAAARAGDRRPGAAALVRDALRRPGASWRSFRPRSPRPRRAGMPGDDRGGTPASASRVLQEPAELDEQATRRSAAVPPTATAWTYAHGRDRPAGGRSTPRASESMSSSGRGAVARLVLGAIGLSQAPAQTEETLGGPHPGAPGRRPAARGGHGGCTGPSPRCWTCWITWWPSPAGTDPAGFSPGPSSSRSGRDGPPAQPLVAHARSALGRPRAALVQQAGADDLESARPRASSRWPRAIRCSWSSPGGGSGERPLRPALDDPDGVAARIDHLEPGARAALEHDRSRAGLSSGPRRASARRGSSRSRHPPGVTVQRQLIRPDRSDLLARTIPVRPWTSSGDRVPGVAEGVAGGPARARGPLAR